MDKLGYIIEQAKTVIGFPILTPEIQDSQILTVVTQNETTTVTVGTFCRSALMEYYSICPYRYRVQTTFSAAGSVDVNVASVIDVIATNTGINKDKFYFNGVQNMDFADDNVQTSGFFTTIVNPFATGLTVGDQPAIGVTPPGAITNGATYFDYLLHATLDDYNQGDPYYEYDPLLNKVRVVAGASGSITVVLGFGLETPEYIPTKHLMLFAKIVSKKILESVIPGRTAITFGDVQVDTNWLQTRLDSLKDDIRSQESDIMESQMVWG